MIDGTFKIYIIQYLCIEPLWPRTYGSVKERRSIWTDANLDHFGYPVGFSASFACWQRTGIHGTFEKKIGLMGLRWIQNVHPRDTFRLVQRLITQTTEVVKGPKE